MAQTPEKIVKAKDLKIVWGNDSRYWRLPTNEDQQAAAELLQVCWLEVTGSCDVAPNKKCQVSFDVSLTPDAFGWNNTTLYIMAKRGEKGRYSWKKVNLTNRNSKEGKFNIPDSALELNAEPPSAESGSSDNKVYFGLYEIWKGNWKGGLKIYQAKVLEI